MADSDIWNPAPCITMKFSQHSTGSKDVLLTYSTDTEKEDPQKAREQASILAEWHFENIPRRLRVGDEKKSIARCALINQHSILIRDIGIIATEKQGDETESQYLTSVSDSDTGLLLNDILRLPSRILHKVDFKLEGSKFRIRIQIDFSDWKATVGDSDYNGATGSSSGSKRERRGIRRILR